MKLVKFGVNQGDPAFLTLWLLAIRERKGLSLTPASLSLKQELFMESVLNSLTLAVNAKARRKTDFHVR